MTRRSGSGTWPAASRSACSDRRSDPVDEGKLYDAALSPDGRTLAVGGYGLKDAFGSIYLISTATGRIERVLKGHTNAIYSLAFAVPPGGRLLLASGSARQHGADLGRGHRGVPARPRGTHEQTSTVLPSLPTPAGWPLRRTTRPRGSGRWPTASACRPSRGTPRRSGALPGAPMGNSWPPAAGIGRSDSGARTEPSPETSRIWTTGSVRSCSPPTPGSCSTPGAGQVLPVSARRSCRFPPDRSGCDSPSMTTTCHFGSHLSRRHDGGHGGGQFPRNLPLETGGRLAPAPPGRQGTAQPGPPAGARTASRSPGATHPSSPRTMTGPPGAELHAGGPRIRPVARRHLSAGSRVPRLPFPPAHRADQPRGQAAGCRGGEDRSALS